MNKKLFKRSMALLLSLAMLLSYAPGLAYLGIESSDSSVYAVDKDNDWTYNTGEGTITAYKAGETDKDVNVIRLSVKDTVYTGQPYEGATVDKSEWKSSDEKLIVPYVEYSTNGTDWSETAPTNAGDYQARLNNGACKSGSVTFTIEKKTPTTTLPTAKTGLQYTGKLQTLVNDGTVEGGHFQYKLDAGAYSDNLPTAKAAGEYTVTYKSVKDVTAENENYKTVEGTLTVTIEEPLVYPKWTYTAETSGGNVIKAEESDNSYGFEDQYLTLIAKNMEYDGEAYDQASIKLSTDWAVGNGLVAVDVDDIEYFVFKTGVENNLGDAVNGTPKAKGEYVARVRILGTNVYAYQKFEITDNKYGVVSYPTAKLGLVYNGRTQELINGGELESGRFEYCLTENGTYSETIPTAVDADEYTVYYKSMEVEGYEQVTGSINVTIDEPATPAAWDINYQDNVIFAEETTNYGFADQTVTLYAPNMAYNGQAYDKASIKLSSNWTVDNNLPSVSTEDISFFEYDEGETNDVGDELNEAPIEVGTYVAVVKLPKAVTVTKQTQEYAFKVFKITNADANVVSLPTAKTGLVYNGKTQELINAGEIEGGYFVYCLTGVDGTYSETIPTAVNADTYTVYYKSKLSDGYKEVKGSVEVVIDKPNTTPKWKFSNMQHILCASEDTDFGFDNQYMTLTASNMVYNGEAYNKASLKYTTGWTIDNGLERISEDEILYYEYDADVTSINIAYPFLDGTLLNGAPTEVGTYYAVAMIPTGGDSKEATESFAYKAFEITAAKATVKSAPTAKTGLVVNNQQQVLFNAGEAVNGTMKYYVSDTNTLDKAALKNVAWSSNPGAASNMRSAGGTYYVYYYVAANDGYDDYECDPDNFITVDIYQGVSAVNTEPTVVEGLVYNGEEQTVFAKGSAANGTMYYYVDLEDEEAPNWNEMSTWLDGSKVNKDAKEPEQRWYTNPLTNDLQKTDAGVYRIYYAVKGANGYSDSFDAENFIEVEISPKEVGIEWDQTSFVYNGVEQKPVGHVDDEDLADADQLEDRLATAVVSDNFAKKDVNKVIDGETLMYEAKITGISTTADGAKNDNYIVKKEDRRIEWQITPRHITLKVRPNLGKTYGDSGMKSMDALTLNEVYDPYWFYGEEAEEYVKDSYLVVDSYKDKMPNDQLKDELAGGIEMDREAGEDAGTYTVTIDASGAAKLDNYVIDEVQDGTYTIAKRNILVEADSIYKIYGEEDPELTYVTSRPSGDKINAEDEAAENGFVTGVVLERDRERNGEFKSTVKINDSIENSFTGSLKRVEGEDVGTYEIQQGTLDSANYNIIYTSHNFRINQREVYPDQLVWGQKSFKYDGHWHVRTAKLVERDDEAMTGLAKRDEAFFLDVDGEAKTVLYADADEVEVAAYTAEAKIENFKNYKFVDGEDYTKPFYIVPNTLTAKATPLSSNKALVSWNAVEGAEYYVVFGAKCGNTCKYLGKTKSGSFAVKKINGKAMKKNTAYKFYVIAVNSKNEEITRSELAHVITNKVRGKQSNVTSIASRIYTAARGYVTELEVGETAWIDATQKTYKSKAWLGTNHGAKYRYVSSDRSVAVVDSYGNVKATGEGTCVIYTQAINGMWSGITLTVTAGDWD